MFSLPSEFISELIQMRNIELIVKNAEFLTDLQ